MDNVRAKLSAEFADLFYVGDEIKYRRVDSGPIYTGRITHVSSDYLRVRLISIQTGKEYWVDSYWIVGLEANHD